MALLAVCTCRGPCSDRVDPGSTCPRCINRCGSRALAGLFIAWMAARTAVYWVAQRLALCLRDSCIEGWLQRQLNCRLHARFARRLRRRLSTRRVGCTGGGNGSCVLGHEEGCALGWSKDWPLVGPLERCNDGCFGSSSLGWLDGSMVLPMLIYAA